MQVLMVAAENGALAGMKVGGIADVVRDVPHALQAIGHSVDVLVPAYALPGLLDQTELVGSVDVAFSGRVETVKLFSKLTDGKNIRQLLLQHSLFTSAGDGRVYCDDPSDRPFATDATKFALFSAAVVECLHQKLISLPDVLHLHDWHTALVAVLIANQPSYHKLQSLQKVFTIHNLALQGTRPLRDNSSSFESWFPHITYNGELICDPGARHCINPMRAGINLADKVHVVSPRYAEEILTSSDHQKGYFGGEGLEHDLINAKQQGRLVGVLNGCEYLNQAQASATLDEFYAAANLALEHAICRGPEVRSADFIAQRRLGTLAKSTGPLVTSIGRLTDQKVLILRQPYQGHTVLTELLERLKARDGCLILLGSGDKVIEQEFLKATGLYENFIFLNIYGEALSTQIYSLGTLFLMPSSFEPCGISQLLAMRSGQPCVAHAVGGLVDTVIDGKNGFTFTGANLAEQGAAFLDCVDNALDTYTSQPKVWQGLVKAAAKSRYDWSTSVKQYIAQLYQAK